MTQTITERKLDQRVAHIQEKAGCRNTLAESDAAAALLDDDASFGFTASYHNQPGSLFVSAVARLRSIKDAQEEMELYFKLFRNRDPYDPKWLDLLLPLNKQAAIMLAVAYQNAGIFRTSEELLKRTERMEFGMEDVA
jgi:hypothetical protein